MASSMKKDTESELSGIFRIKLVASGSQHQADFAV